MSRLKEKYLEILAAWEPLVITDIGGGMVKVQGRPPDHSAPQTDGSHSYVVESLAQILPEPAPLLRIPAQGTQLPLPEKDSTWKQNPSQGRTVTVFKRLAPLKLSMFLLLNFSCIHLPTCLLLAL